MTETNTISNLSNISAMAYNDLMPVDNQNALDIFGAPITENFTALQMSNYINRSFGNSTFIAICDLARSSNLVGTYDNGTLGVGATFTVTATGALVIDSVTAQAGWRIILAAQTSGLQNGIYTVTNPGSTGVQPILTRATDYDTAAKIVLGSFTSLQRGTVFAGKSFVQTNVGITVGTSNIIFNTLQSNIIGTGTSLAIAGSGATIINSNGGSVLTVPAGTKTLIASGDNVSFGTITSDSHTFNTGTGLKTGQTVGNTYLFSAYDTANSLDRVFLTSTAGTTPTYAFSQPTNGTLTWNGGVIGGVTPAAGSFTTLAGTLTTAAQTNVTSLGTLVTGTIVAGGTGTLTGGIVTTAYVNCTPVGTVNAAETDLMSYTLPGHSFSAAGKRIRIRAWGVAANNSNAKTVGFYIGGSLVTTVTLLISTANQWESWCEFVCTGSNTQAYFVDIIRATATPTDLPARTSGSSAKTDTSDIIIKYTGTGTTTNDILQNGMIVEFAN